MSQQINKQFNELLELQRRRLINLYKDSHEVTVAQIDLIISHSYFLLQEVSKNTIEKVDKLNMIQKRILSMAKWLAGLFVSILMALIVAFLTKNVVG
jgi:hypothetical protein